MYKQQCTRLPSWPVQEDPKSVFQKVSLYLTLCLCVVWFVKG